MEEAHGSASTITSSMRMAHTVGARFVATVEFVPSFMAGMKVLSEKNKMSMHRWVFKFQRKEMDTPQTV